MDLPAIYGDNNVTSGDRGAERVLILVTSLPSSFHTSLSLEANSFSWWSCIMSMNGGLYACVCGNTVVVGQLHFHQACTSQGRNWVSHTHIMGARSTGAHQELMSDTKQFKGAPQSGSKEHPTSTQF